MEKLKKQSGFTMAELLIVVAIIAILTAIAIPVFSGQLERSREATDLANLRSAYAEVTTHALGDPTKNYSQKVDLKQKTVGWDTTSPMIGDKSLVSKVTGEGTTPNTTVYVVYVASTTGGSVGIYSDSNGTEGNALQENITTLS